MRRLVLDTTTAWLSAALFDGATLLGHVHQQVGRGHAELLVPAIAGLPDGGRADDVWVGCGPGSFTGLRIGIAAARALAFAWGASIRGFDSLSLIAADAEMRLGGAPRAVVCEGGHGQWLVWDAPQNGRSLLPEVAAQEVTSALIVGDKAEACVALRGFGEAADAYCDCRAALLMPDAAFIAQPTPIYARAPDASLPNQ